MKQFKYIFNNISIRNNSEVWIQFDSVDKLIDSLNEFDIKYIIDYDIENVSYYAKYIHSNALDLLALIFESDLHHILKKDKNQYNRIYFTYLKLSGGYKHFNTVPTLKYLKLSNNAIIPFKARASDAGYDLTIISKVKQLTNNTWLYGTGLKIQIPIGYYAEIVGRSSISKTGYMVANNVGIIDLGYNGELYVALAKIDTPTTFIKKVKTIINSILDYLNLDLFEFEIKDEMPEIELPCRIGQLILKPFQHYIVEEMEQLESETVRGDGGFGSTG